METRSGTGPGAAYDPTVKPAPEKASVVEDFIDIFYAPSTVYARRETSGFWVHWLIVTVIAGLFAFANRAVFEQIFDAEFSRAAAKQMADNPRITQDIMDQQKRISSSIAGFFQYIGTPFLIFLVGVLAWVASKIVKAKVGLTQAVMIVTLAFVPRLIQYLLTTVQMLFMDTTSVTSMHTLSFSPARFMDPDTPNRVMLGLMGRLDLFTLWVTILIGIGIAVMGKVPRSKGLIAAFLVWLVGTLPLLR
jgi:hypothetical protein